MGRRERWGGPDIDARTGLLMSMDDRQADGCSDMESLIDTKPDPGFGPHYCCEQEQIQVCTGVAQIKCKKKFKFGLVWSWLV